MSLHEKLCLGHVTLTATRLEEHLPVSESHEGPGLH